MAQPDPESTDLHNVVYHVFLPPKLPQHAPQEDEQRQIDLEIVRLVADSLDKYRYVGPDSQERYARIARMLSWVSQIMETPLDVDQLQRALSEMGTGDVLALHIRAQNAAVLVRKQSTVTIFETFEVQSPNEVVMATPGKIVRSFPGRAVEIPNSITEDFGFFTQIANFLVKMDKDDTKPETTTKPSDSKMGKKKKSKKGKAEICNTADPHYISQLFIGILRGMGKEIEPQRIVKRIADEVLWNNAYGPWRRSPIWLMVRIVLQTMLSSRADYKHFMIYFEAQLLRCALEDESFSSDLLFVMRLKMARRLYKDQVSAPEFIVDIAKAVAEETEGILQGRWTEVELAQTGSLYQDSTTYIFKESVNQHLPKSRAYLEEAFRGRSGSKSSSAFHPNHSTRLSDVRDFAAFDKNALTSAFSTNSHVALLDFEASVHDHLSTWTNNNLDVPSACNVVASCLKQYTSIALKYYTKDASDKSIMVLTIMELWVALDRLATSQCPLLRDHSPEIGEDLIESLLLRTTLHIEQTGMVQRHLRQRHAISQQAGKESVFSDRATLDSLAVRYFRQSTTHQTLKKEIEQEAQRKREAKLEELKKLNEEYRELENHANRLEHEYSWVGPGTNLSHEKLCKKCSVEREASNMRIQFDEWPLPPSQLDAELVVFELRCPEAIRIWRDATYNILCEIASLTCRGSASAYCTVSGYDSLENWSDASIGTITIASSTKSFISTHLPAKLPADASRVCVNNGLTFKLYDTNKRTWAAGPFLGTTFAKFGTLELPVGSPYHQLFYALKGTEHTSNQVIANQFDCPKDLTLHEYIAFGTLRSGPQLQWMNIVRGLEENLLTFNRDEVYLLHAQAAWQIGSLDEDNFARNWHIDLRDANYCQLLVKQSLSLLHRVRLNWLEANSVRIIIMLVVRLLAATQKRSVCQDAYELLREARGVTLQWLNQLLEKLQAAEIDSQILDYQRRVCEMAAICRSTYDVDPIHLETLLSTSDDFTTLVICLVNLHNNLPPNLEESPLNLQILLCQDRRLTHKTLPAILSRLEMNRQLLDQAVMQLWPNYCGSSAGWTTLTVHNSRWVSTTTSGANTQRVYINLLEGRLLIDGKPLGRLPREYVSHPSYVRLFGQKVLDVVPTSSPGLEFATCAPIRGYQVSFSLDTSSNILLIQAQKDGRTYELIPHTKLADDFPAFFSSDHHHWADVEAGIVEFRPLAKPWEIDDRNWRLKFSMTADSVMELDTEEGSSFLAATHSPLFQSISQRLGPLENPQYLHVTYSAMRQITADLPRMKLSFFVNDERNLESHIIENHIVDENQSSGTMFGLQNQLVLRAKVQAGRNLPQSRTILIPYGAVHFSKLRNHVLVSIDPGSGREVLFYQYKVDANLQYLAANSGLTSRLFKIYLHALTSHCLPDPLTGRTGTEEALYELSEPATSSFEQITEEQAELLKLIGALTPSRKYHGNHLRSIQIVHWGDLSPLSQHYAFATATEAILCRANALRLFIPLDFDPMSYAAKLEPSLLERAAHRSYMYYPPDTTAQLPSILDGKGNSDHTHIERDRSLNGAEHPAFWAASLAYGRWNRPTYVSYDLVSLVESWGSLEGPHDDLTLTYSTSWLDLDLSASWFSIYNLCRCADTSDNRYKLIVSLASATYKNRLPEKLLPVLLAFVTNPAFRDLAPPNHSSYQLTDGYQPTRGRVEQLVSSYARGLGDTPAGELSSRNDEPADDFRERQRSYYDSEISLMRPRYITSLMDQTDIQPASSPYLPWYNVEDCLAAVRQYFSSCSRNNELRAHLKNLEKVLAAQSITVGLGLPALPTTRVDSPCQHQPTADPLVSLCLQHLMDSRICPDSGDRFFQSRLSVLTAKGESFDTSYLASLLAEFQSNEKRPIQTRYGIDLEASRLDLASKNIVILPDKMPSSKLLHGNHLRCQEYMRDIYEEICASLAPLMPAEQVIAVAGIWPRRTPRTILRRLALRWRQYLPDTWREALMGYADAFVECQRAQRLIRLAQDNQIQELFKELDLESIDPGSNIRNPDWVLVQIDGNFRARDMQSRVATEMISPSSRANTVLQLNMGEGKSSVIVPITAATLADSSRLVRVVVLKPLWRQMFQLLVSRLAGLAGRRVYYLPFGRHISIGSVEAQRIQEMYFECMREGGILLVQPEHILSFKLMGIDRLISSSTQEDIAVAHTLRNMQDWLTTNSRDILDESDEILHVRYQLVYTVGQKQPPEDCPARWIIIQQIFPIISQHISLLKPQFPGNFIYERSSGGQLPFIRIMPDSDDAVERLVHAVAQDVLDGCLPNLNLLRLSPRVREMALRFLTERQFPEQYYDSLKDSCDSSLWKGMLLLRGLLASGVLVFALKDKHYRVDYGLDHTRSLLAVPYYAKDIPSLTAEFGHPDVAIVLTCLSYYYRGLTDAQLDTCFELLYKLDNPAIEYQQWVRGNDLISHDLQHLGGVNVKDREQFTETLIPAFSRNASVVNFFLAFVVFPNEAKEFPHKLAASSWDLAQAKNNFTTGFSGTNDNQYLLPTSIGQADPFKQSSTSALVLTYLLQPENNAYACTRSPNGNMCSTRDLLKLLVKQQPEISVLLDVGAQMLELKNKDLVRCWLNLRPDISAAVFFNDNDELMVLNQTGTSVPFASSPFSQQLDKCIVYLDDGHTRGTDLKLPERARAAVTLGPKVTKDRLLQGCMRMRKLGHGQSVMFLAPADIDSQIRRAGRLGDTERVGASDILRWAMLETCSDLEHHISHWAEQGVEYKRRTEAEQKYTEAKDISVLKLGCTTPESRPLEEMYGMSHPKSQASGSLIAIARDIPSLCERLDLLGVWSLGDSSTEEEQEREANREIEREPQIERLPKPAPAVHSIHQDLSTFILTGSAPYGSSCLLPLFHPLSACHSQSLSAWSIILLATADFCQTLTSLAPDQLSDYMRPLNWVLSSRNGTLVALSPYEVNSLLPQIRASNAVRLHVYAPRVTQSMRSFSDLQFYSIPSGPTLNWSIPSPLIQMQLNLWAGQLYLKSYDEYCWFCAFLGIYMDPDSDGAENIDIQSDGFVMPENRLALASYRPEYALCRFSSSPVNMLRELVGRRRKGMDYMRTHLGQVLYARKVTPNDF